MVIHAKDKLAQRSKGRVLRMQGNLKGAIDCYNQILARDGKDKLVWNSKGFTLEAQGDLAGAIKCYDRVLAIDSQHKHAVVNKGNALFCQQQFEKALACFEAALSLDASFTWALQSKSVWLLQQGKKSAAEALWQQVQASIIKEPLLIQAEYWYERGCLLAAIKAYADAKDAFKQAAVLIPEYALAKQKLKELDKLLITRSSSLQDGAANSISNNEVGISSISESAPFTLLSKKTDHLTPAPQPSLPAQESSKASLLASSLNQVLAPIISQIMLLSLLHPLIPW